MNYFELYPGDYLRDTSRLSMTEHGAYLRLMLTYYAEESPLPADLDELCIIAGATKPADRQAVAKVADRYFPVGDDGMRHNGRADEEIVKAQKRIQTARQNGARNKPTRNPAGDPLGNPAGMPTGSQRVDPADTQPHTQSGEALHTPHATIEATPANAGVVAGKPAPPECPHVEIIAAYHDLLPELPRVRTWDADRQSFLRSRWREKAERQTVDWWRGYFEFVRSCPFLMGDSPGRDGAAPFLADLEWLIRPSNFRKVIEGKYQARRASA